MTSSQTVAARISASLAILEPPSSFPRPVLAASSRRLLDAAAESLIVHGASGVKIDNRVRVEDFSS
jgi:hypothetical protein